jgi:Mg2+-importing ATPase
MEPAAFRHRRRRRDLEPQSSHGHADERDLTFAGFVTFSTNRNRAWRKRRRSRHLGVAVNHHRRLEARREHISVASVRRGTRSPAAISTLNDEALWHEAEQTEVSPRSIRMKERIILALGSRHVVGFLGDGVNDAPAMHAADTSLSVEQSADVAREVADFVLLERDLDVIRRGIAEGRRTFANTLKYVLTTTSANLGNMASMAAASLFLPFLPLTAGQILLNNFLSDIPAVGIARGRRRSRAQNRRAGDMRFIARFMVEFGILSSVFDLLTFAFLLFVVRANVDSFAPHGSPNRS